MNFISFEYDSYYEAFMQSISELALSLEAASDEDSKMALEMIAAMVSSMEVMTRVNADSQNSNEQPLSEAEVSQVGDYALTLLDEISMVAANRGLQDAMMSLHRLSLPVALWIAEHRGKISKLEIAVNAIAAYANELKDNDELAGLCDAISKIIDATAIELKQDMDAANPMRPWRIINLNWGIVATRSYQPELIEQVFAQLVKNIPLEAPQFFAEGMEQMDRLNYPDNVRTVMEKYNQLWSSKGSLH